MQIKIIIRLAVAVVVLSSISILSAYSMLQPHQLMEEADCNSCHLGRTSGAITADPILLGTEETLCGSCHQDALVASHPSGISPSMQVPEKFPLDWKGDITCSTCHEIHSEDHGSLRADQRGASFCGSCHQPDFFTRMADEGLSTVVSGHLNASGILEDPYSIECMICHEDKDEPGQAFPVQVTNQGVIRHQGGNHPVGNSYSAATVFGGYRDITQLHKDIILPNGLVSCVSCHLGYSENHGQLVMSNEHSDLCFQCHQL